MSLMPALLGAGSGGGGGGDPGDSASIPSNGFITISESFGTAYSGAKFASDGQVYERQAGGGWSNIGSWLLNGTNSDFYVIRTINSGSLTTDAGAGPLQLNTDRVYDIQRTTDGESRAAIEFSIVDSGETVVYANRQYNFNVLRGLIP